MLALLKLSDACQLLLLEHLSEFGDKTMFLEDAFSNPRLKVGAKPRCGSQTWNQRLLVTSQGQLLMLKYLHKQHQQKLPGTHKKLSKEAVEEALNTSQLLLSLVSELTAQTPIATTIIQSEATRNNFFVWEYFYLKDTCVRFNEQVTGTLTHTHIFIYRLVCSMCLLLYMLSKGFF